MTPLPPPRAPRESDDGKQPLPVGIPGNCLPSSALRHLPRLSPSPRPLSSRLPTRVDGAALVGGLRALHATLASIAERWARALEDAAACNGFLAPLLSIPANFQRFCQTHCRRSTSPNSLAAHNFAAILPGDSVAGLVVANGINNFLNLYNTLLIVRILLTWFPNAPPAIVSPLSTLCDPYLNIFRGIIPPLGGSLDLSPILAFLVLNAFQSTAAALPAELPAPVGSRPQPSASPASHPLPFNLTTMQEKWMRRLHSKRSKNPKDIKRTTQ
ncbi:hypothetical protein Taro_046869 [Colocasia esculenta]|uniref:Uncharacterized protein n=1 Tax=Colocasia esculenta TaxID=4460 RepID=A0A843WTM4_COLES|nr:hypothetical protein [Colocasia esculenta]